MRDYKDFSGWYSNSWQTYFFFIALFVAYINYCKYEKIEIRCAKWVWIIKE